MKQKLDRPMGYAKGEAAVGAPDSSDWIPESGPQSATSFAYSVGK